MFYLYPKSKLEKIYTHGTNYSLKMIPLNKIEKLYFNLIFCPVISPVLGYFAARRKVSADNLKHIGDVEIAGISSRDHPDYVDAFICKAVWKDSLTNLTEAQLDSLNSGYNDFVYEAVIDYIY